MTLEDMGIPAHVAGGPIEDARYDVRATRIVTGAEIGLRAELWMGGGYTLLGDPVRLADLTDAWVVDCAGELPAAFASAASRVIYRVFEDIEQEPADYAAIRAVGRSVADALRETPGPTRVYVMCKQGLNRSGLLAGRVLRELGVPPAQAVELLQRHRPGALSNLAFRRLLLD